MSVCIVVSYCGDTCLGPECAVDRRATDDIVLVVRAVVGQQRVGLDGEVLEEGHEKPTYPQTGDSEAPE